MEGSVLYRRGSSDHVATGHAPDATSLIKVLREKLGDTVPALILYFYSQKVDADRLATLMKETFEQSVVVGCSSAGMLTPSGFSDDGVIGIAFDSEYFDAVAVPLLNLSVASIPEMHCQAASAVRDIRTAATHRTTSHFSALLFTDGLCNQEERLISSIYGALEGIPLVGGSAGDDLHFEQTHIAVNGAIYSDAAALILLRSDASMLPFRSDHFDPTSTKLVVTKADVEKRIVYEINANRAADEYAAAVGLTNQPLSPMSFAAHPVVVRVGGEYYVRSIQKMNDDGSLTFFCAIDEGIVLTVAKCNDMAAQIRTKLDAVSEQIGTPQIILGFECVLRRLEAEIYQINRDIENIYVSHNVVGFNTYGEQFQSMHLNQTFSGLAIGRRKEVDDG